MAEAARAADVVIIGGGIAGLAVAHHLAHTGAGRVVLLERESLLASHATARNAAIFLPVERDEASMRLAARQAALLDALFDGNTWLDALLDIAKLVERELKLGRRKGKTRERIARWQGSTPGAIEQGGAVSNRPEPAPEGVVPTPTSGPLPGIAPVERRRFTPKIEERNRPSELAASHSKDQL